MRVLILEEALQQRAGHWPVYLGDIARGLRSMGDTVHLLAHRQADPALLRELEAVPWLRRSCWSDPRAQGQLGGLRHSVRFARDLRRWLRQVPEPYHWICSLTMRLPHLLAFTLLARSGGIPPRSRCLLLFVQGFGVYAGPDQPVHFPPTASNRLARWCFRRLRPAVRRGSIVLAAETEAMRQELARFSGLPVVLFPHPVQVQPLPAPVQQARPVTITCPGFARHEKGTDLLQQACRLVWAEPGLEHVHVVCQWPEPFALPDGRQLAPDPDLVRDRRFELINENLGQAAYHALLARTDLIVLPYRRESYHNRVSRVAIEAAIHGIPLLPMRGTWAEELSTLAGGSVVIEDETPEALADGVMVALKALSELNRSIQAGRGQVASFHSVATFRWLLVQGIGIGLDRAPRP
jgi:glycosyltransferase involved in cell wall biosynthesis